MKENLIKKDVLRSIDRIKSVMIPMPLDKQVELLNEIRASLHQSSPFKDEPVDLVLWVKNETVHANDYNPNSVAPPEMQLLQKSIEADGYTQPIVSMLNEDRATREVIDGFHRNRVGKESKKIQEKIHGYLPVVTIRQAQEDKGDRIASTIRHNRARGKHKVESMSEIVVDLKRRNWSPAKIANELGMDQDEILRLSQLSGLTEMFKDKDFNEAWEPEPTENDETL